MRLGAVDLGFNGRQLFARGCAVNTVPQSKIEAGIHGVSVGINVSPAGGKCAAAYRQWARIAPSGICLSPVSNSGPPDGCGEDAAMLPYNLSLRLSRKPSFHLAAFAVSRAPAAHDEGY